MVDTVRHSTRLAYGWMFTKADPAGAASPDHDDSDWSEVRVPHDWAIAGPFDVENDLQRTTIEQDGIWEKGDHTGRTGGLPHVGIGWYRLKLDARREDEGKRFFIEFDGVMANSTVYLNGERIGGWPYGYASFCFELTDHVRFDAPNVLAVRVEVKPNAARWYPGAGIYRNVRLVTVNPVHVAYCGATVTTPAIRDAEATVRVQTKVLNQSGQTKDCTLETEILDPSGASVASVSSGSAVDRSAVIDQTLRVPSPLRWDVDAPHLYTAVSTITVDDKTVDLTRTTFGIREILFDKDQGFSLNGRNVELKGVCMHHDLGPLGAALNGRALERQWDILIEMGCNALRTSHNPPAPELLDLCDRRGILVIDEAFDEWNRKKCGNGYNSLFDEWAERDLRAFIRRDRNHPCVIMWSIGNEIPEQHDTEGADIARRLIAICHEEDSTRPVTAGCNLAGEGKPDAVAEVLDVAGLNYQPSRYAEYRQAHPDQPLYGSENESCVSSRGEYHFPVEQKRGSQARHESLQLPSYDLTLPGWGNSPDIGFAYVDDLPYVFGEFVWTGFDYLGEPTPYYKEWPSRSSYFGIVDLCGIPKDRYYLYRSRWRPDTETLHLLPHWTWPGREGEITPVHCYTNHAAAELFVNGVSQGIRRKDKDSEYDRYRLRWNEVCYELGVLKVVALDVNGSAVSEAELRTAGPPARIELTPDRPELVADGDDLLFVTVRVTDADGVLCPMADTFVNFELDGPAEIAGVGNGDPASIEPFVAPYRKAFHGLCMLIVRSDKSESGLLKIRASSDGLTATSCEVEIVGDNRGEEKEGENRE